MLKTLAMAACLLVSGIANADTFSINGENRLQYRCESKLTWMTYKLQVYAGSSPRFANLVMREHSVKYYRGNDIFATFPTVNTSGKCLVKTWELKEDNHKGGITTTKLTIQADCQDSNDIIGTYEDDSGKVLELDCYEF